MPVLDITVSLSEVLEVQGTPLQEPEIWATLCQSAELLQDLFLKGEAVSDVGPTFVIFPDTISLCSNGKIEFSDPSRMVVGHSPAAPETLGHMVMSDTAIEKIYVYSVGRSLYEAATYGLGFDQPMNISRGLDTLLHAMCEEDPSVRVALVDVLEACAEYVKKHPTEPTYSQSASRLYRSVLGDADDACAEYVKKHPTEPTYSQSASRLYRSVLGDADDACAEYVKKHPTEPTYSQSASRLYRSVLGDADDDDVTLDSTHGSDKCHQSIFSLTPRSKKSRRKPRHSRYKGRNNEKSLSRSPSRSRSRSPQRHHRYDEKTDREYFRNGDSFNRHYYKASSHIEGCIKKDKLLHQDFQDYHGILPCDRNQSQPVFHVNQPHSPRYMKDTGKINGHHSSQSNIGHPVYEKYKKLKERQRKLRALRQGLFRENIEEDSLLLTDRMECMSDTRSLLSLASYTQGMYMPDVHTHYGSETALRMGRDSDRESVISSEISLLHQDSNSMRAGSDTIDPFIQDLQQIPHPPSNSTSHHKQNDEEHKTTITKPKDFVGPEFVYRATKPIARILMPLQGESMKNPVHVRRVVVVLLTGQKLEVMCDPCTTGQQLFEAVITHISLPEFFFFGLTYISDGEHFFVESDMKLHKVAPSGWRDGGKGNMATITLTVYLRIKYYVDNLLTFRHHVTRHLLYLQLRRDILEDRSQCSEDKSLTLAGLSLQAEYGDYDKDMNGRSYFVPEHYFSHRVIQRVGTAYVRDNGAEMHAAARDMTEMQAEMDFIREVQKLPEYGVHFYKLFKNKNDTNSPIWIGIASSCLLIAESMGNQRNIIHQHPWGKTQKISFKKRRFSVQPKTDYGQAKPLKMNFYTNSYKKGHYLLQFSTAQHRFLLKMKARAADPDLQDVMMDSGSVEDENMVMVGGDNGLEAQFANDDRDNTDVDSQKQRNASAEIELQNPENKEMQNAVSYMNPPLYRSNHGISMEELREQYVINPSLRLPFERDAYDDGNLKCSPMHGSEYGSTPHITDERVMEHDDYYLDMSNKSLGRSLHHLPAEPTSDTLHERFNKEFLSPVPLDREMFEVALRKEPHFGIGITIVGGENTDRLDLGIFVKSVIQEGPADQDGRLKPGDRIIAINGYSLEGKQHHVAVKMIQDAVDEVTLLISHVRPPKTIRRKVYGDTSAEDKLSIFVNSDDDVNTCNRVEAENDIMYRSNPSSSIDSALTRDYLHGQHDINDISQIHQPNISTLTSDSSVHSRMSAQNSITTESLPDDEYSDTNDNKVYPSTDYRDDSSTDSDFDNAIETIVVGKQKTGNDTFLVKKTCNKPDITDDTFRVKPIVVTTNKSFINDKCTNVTSVKNQKKNGCFEIMIAGEKENKSKNNQISGLLPGGTAEHEGIIVTGGINGFANTLQCNNNIALTELDNEDSVDELGCSHSLASRSSTQKMELDEIGKKYFPFVMKDNTFEVELNKGSGGVGLCISCVEDNHPNDPFQGIVWVKQVSPFGPAAASQKFQQGDIILEVNKQQLKGLMKSENRSLLRGASNPVRLLICRPHSDQIPPWLQDEMEESFLSITPMSSISTTSASTISESDNEKITFRHQVIAPPVQFNSTHPPNEYIDDSDCDMFEEHGDVFYKPVSPPPAPSSSPPTINLNSLRNTPTNEVAIDSQHNLFLNLKLDNIPCTDTNNDNTPQQVEEIDEDIMSEFNRLSNKGDNVDFPRNSCISDKKLILRNQDKIVHYNGRNASKLESVDLLNSSGEGLSNVNNNISGSSEDRFIDFTLESLKSCDVKECLSLDQIDIDTHEQSESSESMLGSPQLSLDMPSSDEEEIDPLKPGEFELILTKRESGGLGFTVAGGANTTGGCFIKSIVQDPALSDGRLRPGDKLIKVNGYDMMSLSHFEAVTLLRQAPQVVTIRISRDPDLWESTDISATSASEETLFDGSAILVNHFSSPRNRNGKASFPSSVASCEKPVLDEHSLESVQILSPNDDKQRIQGLSNTSNSIHSTERTQKTSGKILLSTAAESNEEVSCAFSSLQREFLLDDAMSNLKLSDQKDIIQVELQMQEQSGLGFSMVLAESHKQMEIIIKSIAPGGVAAQNGRLQVGDRLLQINEESLVDLNRTEAIAMLKKVSGRVILTVSRSQCHKLEWSTVSDSESEVSKLSAIKHQGTHVDEDTAITDISSCESTDGEDDNVDILVAEAEQYLHESETIDLEPSKLNSVTLTPLESRNNPSIYSDVDTSNDNCSENRSFNFKKLNVNIPETITDNWLSMLPLVTVPEELRIRIPSLIGKLQEKIEQHETLDEFKTLRHRKNVDSIDVASQAKNKNKNRFRNVLPYDKNRVILDGENNYINASHITMAFATGKNHYIASQGPLLHTADEFWIMVWEQQSDVIVMLTQDMEARKVKCHRYWPDFVETPLLVSKNQHKIEVTLVSLQTTANIDIRLLQMKHQKTYETHQVNHLVYTSWPDHGVPDSAIPLLQYLQLVHMLHHSGPVIVHCSAGIGRTGTFITVDTMLTYIEKGQECSIFEIVKELRKQRSGMIQTKDQYMFCFSASIEALLG